MFGSAFGIGRYIEHLTRQLLVRGTEHTFVLFVHDWNLAQALIPEGSMAEVHIAPERWYSWAEQFTWPSRIRRQKLDVLFVPQFNVPLYMPVPFVTTIHDMTQWYVPGTIQRRSLMHRMAFRLTIANAVHRAQSVIAVSAYTKGEILKHFPVPPERIHVIFEGTGLPVSESKIKERFDGPYLLAVSAWRKHKNFEGLLEAFALLKKQRSDCAQLKLVLVGEEDPRYPEVRAAIMRLRLTSSVLTPGAVDDGTLDHLYKRASAVVVPSFFEGFALTGLEALVRGIPVAASRAAALPEVLGDAALYFDPADHQDMATALERVLTDTKERKRILAAAPEVLARCSWRRAAKETLYLLEAAGNRQKA